MRNKYKNILNISGNSYKDKLYIHRDSQCVITTDGHKLLASRVFYPELAVMARLLDTTCIKLQDNEFIADKNAMDNVIGVLPTIEKLASYKVVRLTVPAWIASISKRVKIPAVSFILGDAPILAMGDQYPNSRVFNAHLLAHLAGQSIAVYFPKENLNAIVIMPASNTLENCSWYSLVMPMRSTANEIPSYV